MSKMKNIFSTPITEYFYDRDRIILLINRTTIILKKLRDKLEEINLKIDLKKSYAMEDDNNEL